MKQWIRIGKHVFLEFVRFNQLFTLICILTLLSYGEESNGYLILIKFVGYLTTFAHYYFFPNQRLYFFYNLGWGIRRLVITSILMDVPITLLALSITNLISK